MVRCSAIPIPIRFVWAPFHPPPVKVVLHKSHSEQEIAQRSHASSSGPFLAASP